MSIFKTIGNIVSGPVRGVVNLAKGDIKGALGAFGDTLKPVGMGLGLTGVGLPLATGLSAAGGAMQKFDDEDFSLGSVAKGGLSGAGAGAAGAGLSAALKAAGPTLASSAAPSVGSTVGNVASNVASKAGQAAGGVIDAGKSGLSRALSWVGNNPEFALGAAGTAADVYGASQEGSARDRELSVLEADRARQRQREELDMLMRLAGSQGRY